MRSKRTITLFSFVCVLALALSIPSTLVAGEKNRESGDSGHFAGTPEAGTWITTDASGQIVISTAFYTNPNSRTWNMVGESGGIDWSIGGFFRNIAPVQELAYGEGRMTGPGKLENVQMQRVKYIDGSIAYILISRGKGIIIDAKTMKLNVSMYLFLDLDGDGLPDYQLEGPIANSYTSRHLSEAVPLLKSLPAPDNYPEP